MKSGTLYVPWRTRIGINMVVINCRYEWKTSDLFQLVQVQAPHSGITTCTETERGGAEEEEIQIEKGTEIIVDHRQDVS